MARAPNPTILPRRSEMGKVLLPAAFEVLTGLLRFGARGLQQVFMVVDGGGGEGLIDRASSIGAFLRGLRVSPTLELQLDAGAFGEVGDGLGKVLGLEVHQELDGVAAPLAAETVVETPVRGDAEGGGLLLVVWVGAEAGEAGALAAEGGELRGYFDDVGGLAHVLNAALRDPQPGLPIVPMYRYLRFVSDPMGRNVTLPTVGTRHETEQAPRAGYADLPPGVGFAPKDEPLRRDINLLGRVLGQVLIEQEGRRLFDAEEEVRLLCKRLRFDPYDRGLDERLRDLIDGLEPDDLNRIVRAFSVYFQLVNIAERYHRVRRSRQYEASPDSPPQPASTASALSRLKNEGVSAGDLQRALDRMNVG